MARAHVLLIEPDTSSAAFMRHMLTRAGYQVEYAPSGKEGMIAAWRDQPDVIILELELPDIEGLALIRKLRGDQRTARKRIICLTNRSGAKESQQAMAAGVDHFLVKQGDAVDMLLRTLAEDLGSGRESDGTSPIRPGRILSFLGAKGGVGTSSLCLNIAETIATAEDSRIVVVDLVLPHGFLTHLTGSTSPVDVVHLTTGIEPAQLSPDYLRSNLPTPTSWSFQFASGARDPAQGAKLHADRLAPVLQTLRAAFDRVIIDLGRTLSPLTLLVLRQTDVAVMVFSPEPSVAMTTSTVVRFLEDQGIPRERLFLLSSRPLGTEDLAGEELEATLQTQLDAAIPHLGPNLALSNRLHAPLSLRFPQEAGTQRLAEVARAILTQQEKVAHKAVW
ncbi:MAG TPA: response regulator [Anaerolineales bacterium]|jgi:pilus assembly protein CpaE